MTTYTSVRAFLLASPVLAMALMPAPVDAQSNDDDQIIVTAQMRQGGAQDIRHFRSVSLDGSFLPQTHDLTLEGLMGEHDLTMPPLGTCRQSFCLTGYAMPAELPSRPDDRWFVGLGFDSAADAESMQREPLSLVAVVDRSGSMSGQPIGKVKEALKVVLSKMRKGDRLGIVIYGSDTVVHLPVTDVASDRESISAAIDSIAINGSTYMEAGLRLGYDTAFAELERSHGKTRLMLFTDENPNVGNTSPEGFMGLATAASQRGVGLTTIGVGVHFDASLATKVSSVRGGNLFFLDPQQPAKALYDREFFNMVSEVAHDIEITMTPPAGWRISGVFGVPDDLMTSAPEGAVTVKIASAFLSANGGGIYATLASDSAHEFLPSAPLAAGNPIFSASLAYVDAASGKLERDAIDVAQPASDAPLGLAKAQILVDEYMSLTSGLALYHQAGDKKGAFHALDGFSQRLAAAQLPGMQDERTLVDGLRDRAAYVAGYRGEIPKELKPLALIGSWQVQRHKGLDDVARGDVIELTEDEEFITRRSRGRDRGEEIHQSMQVNERQLYVLDEDLVFDYRLKGDWLRLTTTDGLAYIDLRRAPGEQPEG